MSLRYFANDFCWEKELRSLGEAFEASLLEHEDSLSRPRDSHDDCDFAKGADSCADGDDDGDGDYSCDTKNDNPWENFHGNLHTSAQFFKPKRYLCRAFPDLLPLMTKPDPSNRAQTTRTLLELGSGAGAAVLPIISALKDDADNADDGAPGE